MLDDYPVHAANWGGHLQPEREFIMRKITTSLWFNLNAEEAMSFYKSVFPDFEELSILRTAADTPSQKAGDVVTVSWRIFDMEFVGINGGPDFTFSYAVSFQIACADQAEVDYYWNALTADGGEESACGWCKDKFGLSWQVIPTRLHELLADPDQERARRATECMLSQSKIDIAAIEAAASAA